MLRKPGKPSLVKKKLASKPVLKNSTAVASVKKSNKFAASSKATVSGFKKAERINKEAENKRNTPFRWYLEKGSSGKIVILDKEPRFWFEHQYQEGNGRWSGLVRCIKEKGHCPACEKLGKEGSYVMVLTILDTKPYKDKQGKVHKFSKKLLIVKSGMMKKYERIYQTRKENLRGVVLQVFRDGAKAPNTGDEVRDIKRLSADELNKMNKDNQPVDYDKLFPMPTEEELRIKFNTKEVMGSVDTGYAETDGGDNEGDLDGVWDETDDDESVI